jgi:argininosuccinate synthase
MFKMSASPMDAPDEPETIMIGFQDGYPLSLDGQMTSPVDLFMELNELGAKHGIGRVDIVENRLVGMKSRGVYETPGGTILYKAHQALESICLPKDMLHFKQMVGLRYAELVYNGKWFSQLREALDAFVDHTQENLTGEVRLDLYKGNAIVSGRRSPYSLYREDYASFGQMDVYNQQHAEGFITLWGLPEKVEALISIDGTGKSRYQRPDYSKFKRD